MYLPPYCALINAPSVKLSESWPKFKIFDFHEMLKKTSSGAKESSQEDENVVFIAVCFDLFPVQANRRFISYGSEGNWYTDTSSYFVNCLYGDDLIY